MQYLYSPCNGLVNPKPTKKHDNKTNPTETSTKQKKNKKTSSKKKAKSFDENGVPSLKSQDSAIKIFFQISWT